MDGGGLLGGHVSMLKAQYWGGRGVETGLEVSSWRVRWLERASRGGWKSLLEVVGSGMR